MPAGDRAKLAKLLAMLGSDHAGERAAAGLLADRLVRSANVTWAAVIAGEATCPPDPSPNAACWRADLATCRRHLSRLRTWEGRFIEGITGRPSISPRQTAVLAEIAAGLRAGGWQ